MLINNHDELLLQLILLALIISTHFNFQKRKYVFFKARVRTASHG
jgi:hypothetical protein